MIFLVGNLIAFGMILAFIEYEDPKHSQTAGQRDETV